MKNHSTRETLIWACAAWALGVAALLIWQLVPAQSDGWGAFDRTVQVLSAFGTLGAVIASLWIALRQSRLAERNAVETSMMYAAGIAFDLRDACKDMCNALSVIDFSIACQPLPDGEPDQSDYEKAMYARLVWANTLKRATSHRFYSIRADEIARLSALPKSAANHLYAAVSMVRSVDADLNRAVNPLVRTDISGSEMRQWHRSCDEAARHLIAAQTVIVKAARLSTPVPRGANVFGLGD